jgi:hypothetical protein
VSGQRDRRKEAILRGIAFIKSIATDPVQRQVYGTDLLWCLYSFSATSADSEIRKITTPLARGLAEEWLRRHKTLPEQSGPDDMVDYGTGLYAAKHLGLPVEGIVEAVRKRAAEIPVREYYGFDPTLEAPPAGPHRYDLWCDALITAQAGEIIGVPLGATFAQVIRWLPTMRPYTGATEGFYPVLYAITHTIYTRKCLGPEFEFLRANVNEAITRGDPETMGEFLDSLRAFGMTERDPEIRRGVEYLLSTQNADGSWGNPKDPDVYNRYHSTWTAIDGLREYRFLRARPCPLEE